MGRSHNENQHCPYPLGYVMLCSQLPLIHQWFRSIVIRTDVPVA